jgi:hypothetical protein
VKKCGLVKHVERKYDATTPNICCLRTSPSLDVLAHLIMTTPLRVELPVLLQNYVEVDKLAQLRYQPQAILSSWACF